MKDKYPIQVIDLRFQVDQLIPKKNQLFVEINNDPENVNARLFVILITPRHIEMISNGNKIIEFEYIKIFL